VAIPIGLASPVTPAEYAVTTPSMVMRPMRLPVNSVNHSAPSGPVVIRCRLDIE